MRRVTAVGLLLVLVVIMTGCRVISVSPIGTTTGQRTDPRLIGHWVEAKSGQDSTDVSLQKDGSLRVVMCQQETPGSCEYGYWRVRSAQLGSYSYIDAVQTDEQGNPLPPGPTRSNFSVAGHVPYAYEIDAGGNLDIYMMNDDLTAAAIKAGKIAGFVKPDKHSEIGPEVILTASPAAMDAFLATPEGRKLFGGHGWRWKRGSGPASNTPG